MNYTVYGFWLFYGLVFALYWRSGHRRQNQLMLAASYFFYGFWDHRFLFLILLSTAIDFIGGLGVAGQELSRRRLRHLALLLLGAALVLCSNVRYGALSAAIGRGDLAAAGAALPHRLSDFAVTLATGAGCLLYGLVLPRLYALPEERRRKVFLAISMVANLALLGFFKYCDFFIQSLADLLRVIGMTPSLSTLGILLPAGISFYTFQAMSYTVDIYRGETEPTDHFGDFALFVCFFPHLVAGPIMRAHTLLPQVLRPRAVAPGAWSEGLLLVIVGVFKKVVIADNMAPLANAVFFRFSDGTWQGLTGPEALLGLYAFAFQIYGDFSGYSAIARGISKWLGFELAENFRLPYLAESPSDFWRRWHISLSSWLRDYLYIPLGGNRGSTLLGYRNLMLTMLLGGLWHGASWTFVAWGLYHGLILCVYKALDLPIELPPGANPLRRVFRIVVTFHLVCLGWLLFRADSFPAAWHMLGLILTDFHVTRAVVSVATEIAFYVGLLFLAERALDGERRLGRLLHAPWPVQGGAYAYFLLMILLFHAGQTYDFIYFQF